MKLLDTVLNLVFPPKCIFCGKIVEDSRNLTCSVCASCLPFRENKAFFQKEGYIDICYAPFYYRDTVRDSLHRFKFGGCSHYADEYSKYILSALPSDLRVDLISYVPLSRKRFRERGYNQAELIAGKLSEYLMLDSKRLLYKNIHNRAQSSTTSLQERKSNVTGVYFPADLSCEQGKTVLLIDDIITSGSTLNECARVLKENGVASVICAAVAHS